MDKADDMIHKYAITKIKKIKAANKTLINNKSYVVGSRGILSSFFPTAVKNEVHRISRFPLKGIIAFPGKVSGEALVINSSYNSYPVNPGTIIVADILINSLLLPYIEPAAGIVIEHGGLISHAALLAREMKKICLVNCSGAMASVRSGDIVEIAEGNLFLKKKTILCPPFIYISRILQILK